MMTFNDELARVLNDAAKLCTQVSAERGWHEPRDIEGVVRDASAGERVALIHEEATELLRHVRRGNPASFWIEVDGKPEGAASELADIIIRCLDYAGRYDIRIGDALVHKVAYNRTREHRHGGLTI